MYVECDVSRKYKRYIEKIWYSENESSSNKEKIIPDGFTDIVFSNIDDDFSIRYSGFMTQSYHIENRANERLFGIRLNPTYSCSLIDCDMSALCNNVVPASEVMTLNLETIQGAFLEERKLDINSLDTLLTTKQDNFLVEFTVNMILSRKGLIGISEILQKLSVSRRHLEKEFKRVIGVSPQKYIRIIKLHNYIDSYYTSTDFDGYYDQSHLCKEFKLFIGETPGSFFHQ